MSISDAADIASPQTQLDELAVKIDNSLEEVFKNIFMTAGFVRTAVDLMAKQYHNDDSAFKKAERDFFNRTNLANDSSTKSKLLKIASHFELLNEYKDYIPANFSALYALASSPTLSKERMEALISAPDEKKRLSKKLTVKQVANLLNGRAIDDNGIPTDNGLPLMSLAFNQKEHKELFHKNMAAIEKGIGEVIQRETGISNSEMRFKFASSIQNWKEPKPRKKKSA